MGAGPGAAVSPGEGRRGGAPRLPAPRGRPAGRCRRGLPSSSGCWHEPRWPWKGREGSLQPPAGLGMGFVRPQSTGGWLRGAWGAPGTLTRRQGRPESSPWSVVRLLWLTERCSCGEWGGGAGAEPSGAWSPAAPKTQPPIPGRALHGVMQKGADKGVAGRQEEDPGEALLPPRAPQTPLRAPGTPSTVPRARGCV